MFLANMSHEIRTPLNGMMATAQVGPLAFVPWSIPSKSFLILFLSSANPWQSCATKLHQTELECGEL